MKNKDKVKKTSEKINKIMNMKEFWINKQKKKTIKYCKILKKQGEKWTKMNTY